MNLTFIRSTRSNEFTQNLLRIVQFIFLLIYVEMSEAKRKIITKKNLNIKIITNSRKCAIDT